MVVKTITVTQEAYLSIRRLKRSEESFSDLFFRIAKEHTKTADMFFGIAEMSEHEFKQLQNNLFQRKKEISESFEGKHHALKRSLRRNNVHS